MKFKDERDETLLAEFLLFKTCAKKITFLQTVF